jgi:hypothetical protein
MPFAAPDLAPIQDPQTKLATQLYAKSQRSQDKWRHDSAVDQRSYAGKAGEKQSIKDDEKG